MATEIATAVIMFSECADGWVLFHDNCYLYQRVEPYITWIDAEQRCTQMGTHLTSVMSDMEMVFLHSFILKQVDNTTSRTDIVSFIGIHLFTYK